MENIWQNPIALKIQNGTVSGEGNLCLTCRNAHHMVSAQTGRERFFCTVSNRMELFEPIAKCSDHADKDLPSLSDMREIAWVLMTDKGGRKIGFQSPEQRERGGAPPIGF